jgi:hypothetical protein
MRTPSLSLLALGRHRLLEYEQPASNVVQGAVFHADQQERDHALQIHRMIGSGSYRTACHMCQRLRAAMHDPEFQQLMRIVEVDEAYFGARIRISTGIRKAASVESVVTRLQLSARLASRGCGLSHDRARGH